MREGADVAGEVADLAGDVGEWGGRERERGIQIPHHLRARARGRCGGRGRRRGREVRARSGGATWSGEGGGVADSAAVAVGGGWLEEGDDLTGGPHLSASRREGKGNGPAQTKEAERGRRVDWADGPRRGKRRKKEKEKEERIFLGLKLHFGDF